MRAKAVYELLKKLKGVDSDISVKYRRVLKYIYQDVYNGFLKAEYDKAFLQCGGAEKGSIAYNKSFGDYISSYEKLKFLLDGKNSIVTYLSEMFVDNKPGYVNLFFDKVDLYFDMIDNQFYNVDDFKICSLAINIYCMLYAYHCHKDNFELYAKILDDCSGLLNWPVKCDNSTFSLNMGIIEKIIGCNAYGDSVGFSEALKLYFGNLSRGVYDNISANSFSDKIAMANQIKLDYDFLKECNIKTELAPLEDVISGCVFRQGDLQDCYYYCQNLLLGNRLQYINEKINLAFLNDDHKEQVIKKIKSIDFRIFEYFNGLDNRQDSFIRCFEIIFDSDTYTEFLNKMLTLFHISNDFAQGVETNFPTLINSLNHSKNKRVLDDKILTFESNTANPIKKPNSILERMMCIYKGVFNDPAINVSTILHSIHNNYSLFNFESYVEKTLKEEQERINIIRAVDLRRNTEITTELDEMRQIGVTTDKGRVSSFVEEEVVTDNNGDLPKNPVEVKPAQKFKSIFGKRT